MIDGITVLATFNASIVEELTISGLIVWIVSMIGAWIVSMIITGSETIGIIMMMVVGIIIGVLFVVLPSKVPRYYVTIDPNVSMVEFYDNYEVISRNGDIWKIKVKE